jgi:hypothetical protein
LRAAGRRRNFAAASADADAEALALADRLLEQVLKTEAKCREHI